MRSTSGNYFIALDHIRALAAFTVFVWHFTHFKVQNEISDITSLPLSPDIFLFSIFREGHTGVALFMTLSGYLFAKLLDGKNIRYVHFFWNRFLRLAPLLILVTVTVGVIQYIETGNIEAYLNKISTGFIRPGLPNGGWSITVEFHFYLLLPLLLYISVKSKYGLIVVIACVMAFRAYSYSKIGTVQWLSYWTIIGRLDQFLLGMIMYRFSFLISKKHIHIGIISIFFLAFYSWFDRSGGFFFMPEYPSSNMVWIIMPTLEGIFYGLLIAWYDNSFEHGDGKVSTFVARIGTYSYSIYLLHFFFVFKMGQFINEHIIQLSNFYVAFLFSIICFLLMVPIAHLSYRYIEIPFLRLRTRYYK